MDRSELQQDVRRMRWRLRGAWQWPTFLALTIADAVVLSLLPFYNPGPGGLFPSLIVAGFANLFAVAVIAPFAGRFVRAARRDLPRVVARDYAGTIALAVIAAAMLLGGILHRPAAAAAEADIAAVRMSVHDYVLSTVPALRDELGSIDAVQLEPHLYRACLPRHVHNRWMCLFVTTAQSPPGVTRDRDESPNLAAPGR
jgi:hypothetical protein